ncbi:IclR family transcriptional regulator [Oceanobacillus oncorhynchi subsp. oncorhynchi]|uniref:IclR family transcriptional regulator n=1 Tax=Oceanobacillus TaxID=182709 RepID=UPI0030DDDAD7
MSEVLNKAATLLNLLKPTDGVSERSATELAKLAKYNTATTHRILQDLEKHGLVNQNTVTKKFHLGSALIELGFLARKQFTIQDFAKDAMQLIAEQTKESVYLNILLDDGNALLLDSIDSVHKLRIVEPVGLKLPLHIGGTRRVILAHLDEVIREKYMEEVQLEKRTAYTLGDKEKLKKELEKIREQGYAISFGETTEGTAGISVPIFGWDGVEASLSIATPDVRLSKERVPEFASLLKKYSNEISKNLGGTEVKISN